MSKLMDHRQIEEHHVVERYLQGRLASEEEAAFEEHLLDCAECYRRVKWEDDLGGALRAAAATDVARAAVGATLWTRIARSLRGAGAVWLLAVLAAAALPSLLLVREKARVSRLTEPQINTPIFVLGAARDAPPEAAPRIALGPSPEWLVLSVALPRVEHEEYRATLSRADGNVVWRRDGLVPDLRDSLVISVYSPLLAPGEYLLRLEGLTSTGEGFPSGEYPFRVFRSSGDR